MTTMPSKAQSGDSASAEKREAPARALRSERVDAPLPLRVGAFSPVGVWLQPNRVLVAETPTVP